jgi:hypothetical protein
MAERKRSIAGNQGLATVQTIFLALAIAFGAGGLKAQDNPQPSKAQTADKGQAQDQGGEVVKTAPEVAGKPLTARSYAHLYELIIREPPLSKQEVQTYEENLEAIVALDTDPSGLQALIETTGWSQERLTYVVTKIGVCLSNLLFPENPRLRNAPEFLYPTPDERDMIVDRLNSLVKRYQNLSKPKPVAKEKKAGG